MSTSLTQLAFTGQSTQQQKYPHSFLRQQNTDQDGPHLGL